MYNEKKHPIQKGQTMTEQTTPVQTAFDVQRYPLSDLKTATELAYADFEALAAKINSASENATDATKKVRESFISQEPIQTAAATWYVRQSEALTEAMDATPGLSVVLLEMAKTLIQTVKEWSDMDVSIAAAELRAEAVVDENDVEVAEEIREHLKRLYEMCGMFNLTPEIPLHTRTVKGGGEATYPETSRLNVSDRTNVGRGAKRKLYSFTIDGKSVTGPTPQAVILKHVGSWKLFLDHLRGENIDFAGESFETEFMGKKISASVQEK